MATYQVKEFPTLLRTLRERSGKSNYRMAEISGLDEGYLGRLESGERRRPARDTVVKIALAAGAELRRSDHPRRERASPVGGLRSAAQQGRLGFR